MEGDSSIRKKKKEEGVKFNEIPIGSVFFYVEELEREISFYGFENIYSPGE